jgi:hypothetical protein
MTAVLLAVFLTATPLGLFATASSFSSENNATDVVVLLDVSQSVLPYFTDVTDYVVSSVVKDYLRFGDTFHLLSFGDTTQVEIAEKVTDAASVKSFLGRLYLLYPLARHSDFAGALSYLYQYLSDLPESRPKVVVVITDGVNNPPEGSRTFGMSPEKVAADIEATAAKIRANGWPVHFIKLPLLPPGSKPAAALSGSQISPSEAKGGQSYLDQAAKAMDADISVFSAADKANLASMSLALPSVEFPPDLGKKDYAFSFPIKVTNRSVSSLGLELDHVTLDTIDILSKKSFITLPPGKSGIMNVSVLLPDSLAQGHEQLDVQLDFANGLRVNPQHGLLSLTLERNPLASLFRSGAKVALFIALVAIGLFIAFLFAVLLRRIPRRSSEAPVIAAVRNSAERGSVRGPAETLTSAAAPAAVPTKPAAVKPATVATPTAALSAVASDAAASNAAALLADSATSRGSAREADAAVTTGLLAEAARRSAQSAPTASLAASASVLPSASELAAAKRDAAQKEAALLAEAAALRAPGYASRAEASAAPHGAAANVAASNYAPRIAKAGAIAIELRVEGQNSHIGTRNVHEIHAGSSKTVGGGRSDFLVFLVTVPRRVADLHFDGEKLTLVPLRPEYFPEGSAPIEDCIGKEVRMQGKHGYPLVLRFLPFERPADKMNRLLHCIEAPGIFFNTED